MMITITKTTSATFILASDLGEYKSMAWVILPATSRQESAAGGTRDRPAGSP